MYIQLQLARSRWHFSVTHISVIRLLLSVWKVSREPKNEERSTNNEARRTKHEQRSTKNEARSTNNKQQTTNNKQQTTKFSQAEREGRLLYEKSA
jgi:hypothetical protein